MEWRCADSLSLRVFLRLGERESVPDHSWLSRTRSRVPLEVHDQVFTWVLERLCEHGLIKGERIGVDASTMESNGALRSIVRRDSGEGYREMLTRMAKESGIETPTAEELVRLDRHRKGKKLSNADWESPIDPDARIAKLKDGRTHLAYKPEHAVDLDTGAVVAAELHSADQGDTTTMPGTLARTAEHLAAVDAAPTPGARRGDRRQRVSFARRLEDARRRAVEVSSFRAEADELSRWRGDDQARRAVYSNRVRSRDRLSNCAPSWSNAASR
jgi:transposase